MDSYIDPGRGGAGRVCVCGRGGEGGRRGGGWQELVFDSDFDHRFFAYAIIYEYELEVTDPHIS